MYTTIIFDADGVLLDSLWVWEKLTREYLKSHGATPPDDIHQTLTLLSYEEGCHYLIEHFHLSDDVEQMQQWYNKTLLHWYQTKVQAMDGTEEVLKHLKAKGIRMYVASASDALWLKPCLERLQLLSYFDDVKTEQEMGILKRESEFYQAVGNFWSVPRNQTLVVEDAPHAVESSVTAGFTTVHVGIEIMSQSHYNIKSLKELEQIV